MSKLGMYKQNGPVKHIGNFFVLYDDNSIYFINKERIQGFSVDRTEFKTLLTEMRKTSKKVT